MQSTMIQQSSITVYTGFTFYYETSRVCKRENIFTKMSLNYLENLIIEHLQKFFFPAKFRALQRK